MIIGSCAPPIVFRADVVAQAVESAIGKGTGVRIVGLQVDEVDKGSIGCAARPFSLRKFLAGKQVVRIKHRSSGSSLAKIGSYDGFRDRRRPRIR